MVKVLFVCLGNICRSPMAEAMFRDLVKREGLENSIEIDSAGTGNWHVGKPPHVGTREILDKYKIDYSGQKARQFIQTDIEEFDYIIAMDSENLHNIERLNNNNANIHICRLLDFIDSVKDKDVPDPYFTGNFEEVYELVKKGCQKLLEDIKQKYDL